MANVFRRTRNNGIAAFVTLATADDLNGTVDGSQYLNVKKGERVILAQVNDGADGAAGIDKVEVSIGGNTFISDPTLLAFSDVDQGGTLITALNSAGVEPTGAAIFKSGPFARNVRMRIARGGAGAGGTAWTTGAPSVIAAVIQRSS